MLGALLLLAGCGADPEAVPSTAQPTSESPSKESVATDLYNEYKPDISKHADQDITYYCPEVTAENATGCSTLFDKWIATANSVADDVANSGVAIGAVSDAVADVKSEADQWDADNCNLAPTYKMPAKAGMCLAHHMGGTAAILNVLNALASAAEIKPGQQTSPTSPCGDECEETRAAIAEARECVAAGSGECQTQLSDATSKLGALMEQSWAQSALNADGDINIAVTSTAPAATECMNIKGATAPCADEILALCDVMDDVLDVLEAAA